MVVAVIDTGIDLDHPDLRGNLWTNPGEVGGNGIDDDGNGEHKGSIAWESIGKLGHVAARWLRCMQMRAAESCGPTVANTQWCYGRSCHAWQPSLQLTVQSRADSALCTCRCEGYVDDVHGYDFAGGCAKRDSGGSCSRCQARPSPTDDDGHGTHVAGLVAAMIDNFAGGAGAAPGVKLMILRVCRHTLHMEVIAHGSDCTRAHLRYRFPALGQLLVTTPSATIHKYLE